MTTDTRPDNVLPFPARPKRTVKVSMLGLHVITIAAVLVAHWTVGVSLAPFVSVCAGAPRGAIEPLSRATEDLAAQRWSVVFEDPLEGDSPARHPPHIRHHRVGCRSR